MLSTSTLTSLAMLKVQVDRGNDYLDYLRPFILQVLVDHNPDPVTDRVIRDLIRDQFGLELPERAIQIVLKRLSRSHPLKKDMGIYRISGKLNDPGITEEKSKANRHIQSVINGLIEYSKNTAAPISSDIDAVTAICAFLENFNIPCLKAYLRGTAIPTVQGNHNKEIVLVSEYILNLQRSNPERFDSFMIMVQGHMLANALLCPDLQNATKTYNGLTFYLDTPLLVRQLGLEGKHKKAAIDNLITLLKNLGSEIAIFSHTREELDRVFKGAADHIDKPDGRGAIIEEARKNRTTKSDILLLMGQIDGKLDEMHIIVIDTPKYIHQFQIDQAAFENVLDDEVDYFNPRAKEDDVNSVRGIYVLRGNISPLSVEKSRAVLVTSNNGFARAAYEYGKKHESSKQVSSVITDFSLANIAWLKAPLGAPSLPMTEILSFSYAALQPPRELLSKYLEEIEKLEKIGKISARDHQLLRSSVQAQEELMRLTLGDETALTEETIAETLRRVSEEIKKEENDKLKAERIEHEKTQKTLMDEQDKNRQIQQNIYWRCLRKSNLCALITSIIIGLLLIVGIIASLGLKPTNIWLSWICTISLSLFTLMSLGNLIIGTTVINMHYKIRNYYLKRCLKKEADETGVKLEINNNQ